MLATHYTYTPLGLFQGNVLHDYYKWNPSFNSFQKPTGGKAVLFICLMEDQFAFLCGFLGLAPSVTGFITEPWAFAGQGLLSPAAQTLLHIDWAQWRFDWLAGRVGGYMRTGEQCAALKLPSRMLLSSWALTGFVLEQMSLVDSWFPLGCWGTKKSPEKLDTIRCLAPSLGRFRSRAGLRS